MSNIDNTTTASDSMQDYVPADDSTDDTSADDTSTPDVQESADDTSVDSSDQAPPKEEQSDTFSENFDPKDLSEDLVPAYKQMQADYTRKTQGIADIRSKADQFNKHEALITFLGNNPQLADRILTGEMPAQQPADVEPEIPQEPKAYAEWVQEKSLKDADALYTEKFDRFVQEMTYNNQVQEAERLDPRLQSDPMFGKAIASMVLADADVQSGRRTVVNATQQYISEYDGSIKQMLQAEKTKLTAEAKAKNKPSLKGSPQSTVKEGKTPETMREAMPEEFR